MKRCISLVFLLMCLACSEEKPTTSDLIAYIPRKANTIIKTHNLKDLIAEAQNNSLLQGYATTAYGQKIAKYKDILSHFSPAQESLIAFTKIGNDDIDISFITTQSPALFLPDSLQHTITTLNTTSLEMTKIATKETTFFTVSIDDVFIASSSQLLLENTIRERDNSSYRTEKMLTKAYNTSSDKSIASVLIKGSEAHDLWQSVLPKASYNGFKDAFTWLQADIDLSENDLKLNGVVLVKDSSNAYLELLKDTDPQVNKLPQITPLSAMGAASLTYDDWEVFKNNLAEYQKIDPAKYRVIREELLSSFNEIGLIALPEGNAIAALSLDSDTTDLALSSEQEIVNTFRQVPLYKLQNEDFKNAFSKTYTDILKLPKVNYYCKLDAFFIFAPGQAILENIIANYQNKATFFSNEAYQNTASQLSRSSSLLFLSNTSKIPFNQLIPKKDAKEIKAVSLDNYPFAALQLVQDNGFMHLRGVVNKNESPLQDGVVAQSASTKLDEAIMMAPQLIKNHRTKGMDIVLQDQANNLYVLSNSGKILWKKQLDSPIVGDIQQVDLYRNGRLQLAFTSQNTFYILDRNGKEVAPFPLKFKDDITQPLAIFDYEKNRNYRFIITQTDHVTMYDKTAKKVSGFTFTQAPGEIIFPPQHLRIGSKDYITIAENSGKLNILSRTGKSRIEVADRINFGDSQMVKEGSSFATYDVNGERVLISSAGKVSTTATTFGSGSKIVATDKTTACVRDNILYIDAKKITLPFGSYTVPTISIVKGKSYISTTNIESNQVYLYDGGGQSLENFPVYGVSPASVGYLERNKSLGLVTQGDARTILVYRIN